MNGRSSLCSEYLEAMPILSPVGLVSPFAHMVVVRYFHPRLAWGVSGGQTPPRSGRGARCQSPRRTLPSPRGSAVEVASHLGRGTLPKFMEVCRRVWKQKETLHGPPILPRVQKY